METIHYILVRRDLPFGVTLAMVAHAAANSARLDDSPRISQDTVAVLGVRSKEALEKWERKLLRKNVKHTSFREPDAPYFNELMAIGLVPGRRIWLESYVRKLQVYKEFDKGSQPSYSIPHDIQQN